MKTVGTNPFCAGISAKPNSRLDMADEPRIPLRSFLP